MNSESWLCELHRLLVRFSGLGIGADIAAMGLCELWGVYCLLRRGGKLKYEPCKRPGIEDCKGGKGRRRVPAFSHRCTAQSSARNFIALRLKAAFGDCFLFGHLGIEVTLRINGPVPVREARTVSGSVQPQTCRPRYADPPSARPRRSRGCHRPVPPGCSGRSR
jgi:hypothetical protein